MYCGTCIRDNALAAEMMRQGHDVLLMPLYTPTRTDEANVSHRKVFFGGISVYLEQHIPLFRRTPRFLDRLWDSRLALNAASRGSVPTDPRSLGELTVSMLRGEDGHQRKELEKMLEWLRTQPRFDVVSLPYALLLGLARPLREALGAPICCTLQGEDLFIDGLPEPYRAQTMELIRSHIAHVDRFLAVSEYYASFMRRYLGLPAEKMAVAPIGINLEGFDATPRPRGAVFTVGYFARVAPEKSLYVLVEAYRRMRARPGCPPSRFEAAGYLRPEHREYLREIEKKMREWDLASEFHYRGVLDRTQKVQFLRSLDVLSVPCTYAEPKGLFLLEAMACGVPVVQPRRGAFPEIIEKTGGGVLVNPDDPDALADALLAIWNDARGAEAMGRRGAEGVRKHYSVANMAARTLAVFSEVARPADTLARSH